MTRLIRARWLQVAGAAVGVALVAAFLVGVSPYPTEVLGQTPPQQTDPIVTYRCEGGTLVVTVTIPASTGLPGGFLRETRVPVGGSFICQLILSVLQGGSLFAPQGNPFFGLQGSSLFEREGAPTAGPAMA